MQLSIPAALTECMGSPALCSDAKRGGGGRGLGRRPCGVCPQGKLKLRPGGWGQGAEPKSTSCEAWPRSWREMLKEEVPQGEHVLGRNQLAWALGVRVGRQGLSSSAGT